MPLPLTGTQWPPASLKAVYNDIAVNDAWFTGSVSGIDRNSTAGATGMLATIRERIFGSSGANSAARKTIHVPVAAQVSRLSSSLLFGELFKTDFTDDGDSDDTVNGQIDPEVYAALTKRVNELLDDNAHASFLEAGEYASAHGGSFLRVSWDASVNPNGAFLTVRAADTAVPNFRFGRLVDVIFWDRQAEYGGRNYILLEMHEPGTITFGLYESNNTDSLGHQVPLTAHPDTAYMASMQGATPVGLGMQIETGSEYLSAAYLPNSKPNRALRKDPVGSVMGRSDYDEAGDLFGMLDNTLTSWDRDFRLGKTRVIVPQNMLKLGQPGSGASFDTDQELFMETGENIGALNTDDGKPIQVIQPDIRHESHQKTAEYLFERIYAATGFSAQSFGESGDMAKTATEVSAREKMTLYTRDAKIVIARPVIIDLLCALLDIDYFVFPDRGVDRMGLQPNVVFPSAVSEDPSIQAKTLQTLTLAEAISTEQKVRERKPEWDDQQVAEEVALIKAEYNLNGAITQPVERNPVVIDESIVPTIPETAAVVPVD